MGWFHGLTLCVVLGVIYPAAFSAASSNKSAAASYLLPTDLKPYHYDISLAFDVNPDNKFPFFGVVKIGLTVLKSTSKIVLHSQELTTADKLVALEGRNAPRVLTVTSSNDTYNFLTIHLDAPLTSHENYTLTVPFSGNLKSNLDGVYISSYEDMETGKKEYLVTTQFEAISARKGFPCFDEPLYKATFSMNIAHHDDYTAVSNMPLYNSTRDNVMEQYWPWETMNEKFKMSRKSFVNDQFARSVPMSTYLVAFVVSKFLYKESPSELSKAKFRIWARKDAINQTEYASTIGPKILTYYESWFNVSFPLPKQDMFAIPDFSAGAMENWGLITYRETALLYDKEQSSLSNKERVAEVIAHELAHQWFGNLVTMKWWSDLWLNEGFATYISSLGIRSVEPEWSSADKDAVDYMLAVFSLDSLKSSHPVSVVLEDPHRISEIFDEISYRKGAILIRMMLQFMGEDHFREAIHNYLVKYSYSNAEQDDLWSELTAVTQQHDVLTRNVTVKEIMDTWTTQTGYPLLTVTRDYTDDSLAVSQKRYLALGVEESCTEAWWVPLSVLCENEVGRAQTEPLQWLSNKEGVDQQYRFQHGSEAQEWVLFNSNMFAPYRVNYDERNWNLLIKTLNSDNYKNIPTLSRVQLIADSFALAWINEFDYSTALKLINYLQKETEYLPLDTGLAALSKIDAVLLRSPEYGAFQKFVRKLISGTYERVGGLAAKTIWNPDNLNDVRMQVLTSRWACYMKVPGCEEHALELFERWMEFEHPDQNNPIPLDLRSTVYCVAAARGSVAHWRFLLARKRGTNVAAAKKTILVGMACTREVWILKQFLEWCIEDGSEVRRQDASLVVASIMRSTVGFYVARDFFLNRISDIHKAFPGQTRRLGSIAKVMVEQFTTQRELDEFIAWQKQNAKYFDESKLTIDQAIEKARVNIAWLSKNKMHVVEKLREYSP